MQIPATALAILTGFIGGLLAATGHLAPVLAAVTS